MSAVRFSKLSLICSLTITSCAVATVEADTLSDWLGGSGGGGRVAPGWNSTAKPYPSATAFPEYGGGCASCGAYGPCDSRGGGFGDYGGVCCGPSWYDFAIETVYIDRSISGNSDIDLISDNPTNTTIVLGASSADFDYEVGFRATLRYQLSATDSVEGIYLDGLNWDATVTVNDSDIDGDMDDLFSVFSQFGTFPVNGFTETDQAMTASLTYQTDLESVEMNYRRAWISRNQRIHGSFVGGLRYFRINESFNHTIQVRPATSPTFSYDIQTGNDLLGIQGGVQVGWCLMPGFVAQGEVKAGVYGNGARQNSTIDTATLQLVESVKDDVVSFATDASAWMTWQCHPLIKIRCGYELLFFQDVALASDNFNPTPPNLTTADPMFVFPVRQAVLDDQGGALYHGGRLGVEVGW